MAPLVAVSGVCVGLWPPVSAGAHEERVTDMFRVLREASPTTLPASARRTLARLRREEPGKRIALDIAQAHRVGPRRAGVYLVPGRDGICALHGQSGACSDDLDAISEHGLVFWFLHDRDARTKRRPMDLYGAVPDGLRTVSAVPSGWSKTLLGTNVHDNGYRIRAAGPIRSMIFLGPRGNVSLGPLKRPG
jgi:hypothetical protein